MNKQKSTRRAWNVGYRVVVCGNCNPLGVPAWSGDKPRPKDMTQCPQCRQEARFEDVPTVQHKPIWKSTKELIKGEAQRVAEEAEKEVNGWFEEAFRRREDRGVNLYYSPNAEAWDRLTDVLYIGGVDTGMVCHRMADGTQQLFRVTHGPGDCEEGLVWVGKYETGSVSLGPKEKPGLGRQK